MRYNLDVSIRQINGVYLADTARVVGEVELGANVSIWYGATIRGDVAPVRIGQSTNVQENAVIHCDSGEPNTIGERVTIGHGAVLHGQSVGDGSLVGTHATLLGRSRIGQGCLIAAGALVPPGMQVPDGVVVMGVPGRIVRQTNEKDKEYVRGAPDHYVKMAKLHHDHRDDPRVRGWG